MKNRTVNAKRNILSGIFNKIVTMILPFVIRTILIQTMGVEYLGLNSLFSSVLQVLNLAELGFGQAVIYNMYKPIAENDIKKLDALLNTYRIIYRIIGCVIMGIGLCLLPALPYLISGNIPENVNIYVLFIIYLLNTCLTYWLFAYTNSLFYAFQRNDIINNIDTVIKTLLYLTQIVVLFLIHNYYAYLKIMPLCTFVNNLLTFYISRKKFPFICCSGYIDEKTKFNIKKNVMGLMIQNICSASRNSIDSICISAFLGLKMTAVYNNYYYIISAITGLMMIISNSISAGVGNSIACDTKEKNYEDLRKFNFLYMWIACLCMTCLACLYQPFMNIWVGKDYLLNNKIMLSFCIYFYVLKTGDMLYLYSQGFGLFWEQRFRAMGETILNIALNIILIQLMGVGGIVLATIISLIISNAYGAYIVFDKYFGKIKLKKYYIDQIVYAVAATACVGVTYYIALNLTPFNGIFCIIIRSIICVLMSVFIYIAIFKNTKIYNSAIKWALSKFNMRKLEWILIRHEYR